MTSWNAHAADFCMFFLNYFNYTFFFFKCSATFMARGIVKLVSRKSALRNFPPFFILEWSFAFYERASWNWELTAVWRQGLSRIYHETEDAEVLLLKCWITDASQRIFHAVNSDGLPNHHITRVLAPIQKSINICHCCFIIHCCIITFILKLLVHHTQAWTAERWKIEN
jgi:hypothetical protein